MVNYAVLSLFALIVFLTSHVSAECSGEESRASSDSDLCGSLVGNAVAECLSFCAGESAFSAECRADGLSALANPDEFGLDFNITSNACFCCAGGQVARDVKLTDDSLTSVLPGILLRTPPEPVTCPRENIKSNNLKCDFTKSTCQWSLTNSAHLGWKYGSGALKSDDMETMFNVKETPDEDFLVLSGSGDGVTSTESASITTCPIMCTKSLLKISVRHWQTRGMTLELCFHDLGGAAGDDSLDLCVPVNRREGDRPGADVEVLPEGEHFAISLKASDMDNDAVLVLDDISIEYTPCDKGTFDILEFAPRKPQVVSEEVSAEEEEFVAANDTLEQDKSVEVEVEETSPPAKSTSRPSPKSKSVEKKPSKSSENDRFARLSNKPAGNISVRGTSKRSCVGKRGMLNCKHTCVRMLGSKFNGDASCDGGICECNKRPIGELDNTINASVEDENTVCADNDRLKACAKYCHQKYGSRLRRVECVDDRCTCEKLTNKTTSIFANDQKTVELSLQHDVQRSVKSSVLLEAFCVLTTCSFERDNLCGWTDLALTNDRMTPVRVRSGRTGNVVTGVRNAAHGSSYASFELSEGETSAISLNTSGLNTQTIIMKMNMYDAVNDASTRVCLNTMDLCQVMTPDDADIHSLKWKDNYVQVPAKTNTIYIVAENRGRGRVNLGLDNIEIYYAVAQTDVGDLKINC